MRYLLLILPLLLVACDSNDPDPVTVTSGVLVASQGAFGADDGDLTAYDPETEEAEVVYDGLFVQSVAVADDRVFLASASRVDVLDAEGFTRVGRYDGVPNPRYFDLSGEPLVTNLYTDASTFGEGALTVLGEDGEVERTVPIGGNPDGVVRVAGRVYVANFDYGAAQTVTVLDGQSYAEVERVDVGCDGPRFLFADAEDDLLVLCTGATDFSTGETTNGALVVLDGGSGEEVARVDLPTPLGTGGLGQDADYADGELWAIAADAGRIYRFDTASHTLDATLPDDGATMNAVAYDPIGGRLYVGRLDPDNPYSARGAVTIHERGGAEVGRFTAGVAPSHIAFLRTTE